LLHPKLAGKLRFMDYLDEEQKRAITMKSSSIPLRYKDYPINLIDPPGHMDFCSEVSTAARLSGGALVLVDAVEGVHIQTHAVLRQAWIEKLTPCLVLNKIDRLICELKLSPMEAYNRLLKIVHEVNGIMSAYKSEKYLAGVDSILAGPAGERGSENLEFIEEDDEDSFQSQKGNVAFVCALDGWGFGIREFSEFYASKLGASSDALQKAPLVSYEEAIEGEASNMLDSIKSSSRSSDYVEKMTPNGRCVVCVEVLKLPPALTKVLD
jgi:ribosome assembly protein 1